ncbi:hypothetical protein CLV84_0805 [Neolewinella xylanilytica]|uniref:DoxX-like protein n=1 Tax=Neolewinella xylanilytica TaxID=1514080 RepID=A0A2S6I8P7_9BACT|nr:hypothetical protein [Neolewinella xylanilytica]PPK87852.1 hypothetical protein CLV84_0805 [Neolewinella xylanilytica]
MLSRKVVATVFIVIALGLGGVFFAATTYPVGLSGYFQPEYYTQFGPLAICVELLLAGGYLYFGHRKANFTLALFGFTVVAEVFFNLIGLSPTTIPLYARLILLACSAVSLRLAFTNAYRLGRISALGAMGSFILGNLVELFFNDLFV